MTNNLPTPKLTKELPAYTDNRDIACTELVLEDGTRVDIDPRELFKNALENDLGDGDGNQSNWEYFVWVKEHGSLSDKECAFHQIMNILEGKE